MNSNTKTAQKPKQRISWKKKISNDYQFFKDTADYCISRSSFGSTDKLNRRAGDIQALRDIYASIFPASWFKHVTDPYTINKDIKWPAKIRPLNIIKPNIDFLLGKYPERPFPVQVTVLGDQGYNSFLEGLQNEVYKNLSQQFINEVNNELQAEESPIATGVESQPVEPPEQVKEKFANNYKNTLAVQADADLQLIMEEQNVNEKFEEQFSDYIKVGENYSYKDVIRDETIYERVLPEEIDYSISPGLKYIKDANWVVRRREYLLVDLLDMFYDVLTEKEIKQLEGMSATATGIHGSEMLYALYHVCWRSEEKIGIRTYFDEMTGSLEMDEVTEDYVVDELSGETVEWIWRSRWLEVYRIGDTEGQCVYVEAGKVRYAPNFINNLAKTEGPYNGRIFSPESSHNTSILKMGIPFLISYIIGHFALERIIAKGGGKIALIDQNIIPKKEGWTESKFFQFAEAKGWALIDRNQVGVDKSFNQYQVLDMSLYDHISNIIQVMEFSQSQYDVQLGITRQAKGDISQRDSVTGTRISVAQSSVVTEMIFADFEKYKLTEYQGLINCSQISAINGKRRLYTASDGRKQLLDLNPNEYPLAQFGIMAVINPLEASALEKMRNYGQALAQNGVEASTLLEIETARSIPRLKELLLNTERTRQQAEQEAAQREAEAQENLISLEREYDRITHSLELDYMHQEYNRKQDLVMLQGDINMAMTAAETGQEVNTGNPALDAYMKYQSDSEKIEKEVDLKNKARLDKKKAEDRKLKIAEEDAKHKRQLQTKESIAKIAAIKSKANQKPPTKSK